MAKVADIQSVLNERINNLTERKKYIIGCLDSWEQERIEEIKKYVIEQKAILDKNFKQCKDYLEKEWKEKIAATQDFERLNDNEQLERLRFECHTLSKNLLMISQYDRTISYLRVSFEKQSKQKNTVNEIAVTNNDNLHKNNDKNSRRSSIVSSK